MPVNILAIDTVSEQCSVSLMRGASVYRRSEHAPRLHGELVLPWIRELLEESGIGLADLDRLAVDTGPGSFTGVRIGISLAQGLSMGLNRPLAAVSSLDALAWQWLSALEPGQTLLVAMDARMNEAYAAGFRREHDQLVCIEPARLCAPEALDSGRDWDMLAGSAFRSYADRLGETIVAAGRCEDDCWPDAREVALLAERQSDAQLVRAGSIEPFYLRNNVAKKSARPA